MHKVTAKVYLGHAVEIDGTNTINLEFLPDYQDERNKEWAEATPTLSMRMAVKRELAEFFKQGQSFTLTFEKSDDNG